MLEGSNSIEELGNKINLEKNIVDEISSFSNYLKNSETSQEKKMVESQLSPLIEKLKKNGEEIIELAESVSLSKPLNQISTNSSKEVQTNGKPLNQFNQNHSVQNIKNVQPKFFGRKMGRKSLNPIEKLSVKRFKKKEEKEVKKKKKNPSRYIKLSSKLFYDYSISMFKKDMFRGLKRDLVRGNVELVPAAYISMVFFSTILSFVASIFILVFFLFFSLSTMPPFILGVEESLGERFLKIFWIVFAIPIATFMFGYTYPSLERKSLERKIDRELPFATIHMSAISNSMIEPSKIFGILVSTEEYPNLGKELVKLQNEINIYGYDLVTALRNRAFNSPSRKLAELFNGLATTITSGGNLPVFFDKRSQSLLFEYRLDMEKEGKAAETFMDIYISVVIAAPMVMMLLLMMMSISGLGITLSPGMISLIIILGVALINIMFLAFLHLRQPEK